jgi:hypothetical protein
LIKLRVIFVCLPCCPLLLFLLNSNLKKSTNKWSFWLFHGVVFFRHWTFPHLLGSTQTFCEHFFSCWWSFMHSCTVTTTNIKKNCVFFFVVYYQEFERHFVNGRFVFGLILWQGISRIDMWKRWINGKWFWTWSTRSINPYKLKLASHVHLILTTTKFVILWNTI